MVNLGRDLMFLGALLLCFGAGLYFGPRLPWLGHLPGDFYFKKEGFTFYFPLGTGLFVSLLITLLARFLGHK